ncbi:MAG: CHAT domain-containing protein [Bacteroidales bacterium]|nr:CHAT domain-containing protein [Bacteroidales bacterium]
MRKALTLTLLMMAGIASNAQNINLETCVNLYESGYWKDAYNAYNQYINSIDDQTSAEYYIAISNYGELLYYMGQRITADSLLKTASENLKYNTLFASNSGEAIEAISRYSCLSSQSGFKEWGITELSLIGNKGEKNLTEYDETSNYKALIFKAQNRLRTGLTLAAKQNLSKAESIVDNKYGDMSLKYALIKMEWAKYYVTTTNFGEMLSCCNTAMEIMEQNNLTDGVHYADAMLYKAIAESQLGNHTSSLALFHKALSTYSESLGEQTIKYAEGLYYLGRAYGTICDIDNMLECENRAAKIFKNVLGDNNSEYAAALNEIGVAYSMRNDTKNEFAYYEMSLEANKKFLGAGSYQTALQYYNISLAYTRTGNYEKALEYIKVAQRIAIAITGINSVFTADCMTQRGLINIKQGKAKIATAMLQSAKTIYESALSAQSPKIAHINIVLGQAQYQNGKYDKACQSISEGIDSKFHYLVNNFTFMTTAMRNLYWQNNAEDFAAITRLCWKIPDNEDVATTAYNCELISKGIMLSSEIEFGNIINKSGNQDLIRKYSRLQEMRQTINAENMNSEGGAVSNIDSLERESQKIEKELVTQCREYGDLSRPISIKTDDIRLALNDNEAAIEFVKISASRDSTIYGALILRNCWHSPKFVKLFSSSTFSEKFHSRISPYQSTELYQMIWKPMERYLEGTSTIYFSPTGSLYNTAIEYAPINDSTTISEKYNVYRISSTRNLVDPKSKNRNQNITVYGGIYYNTDTTTMRRESDIYNKRGLTDSYLRNYFERNGGLDANYLEGTEKEAQEIIKCMSNHNYKVDFFTKNKANEESFKNLSGNSIDIIHIATHGFYMDDRQLTGDNNLLTSGLLMSGCNNIMEIPSGVDDGILTAREISYLDFRNTDMVVLSACETGLGHVTADGVFGLQRGFKMAGVNTIVMSLWPVNDYATKLLMTRFYQNMSKGMEKREAFIAAQQALRTKKGVRPEHWAAFIMLDGE